MQKNGNKVDVFHGEVADWCTIGNFFTFLRIALTPCIVMAIYRVAYVFAVVLFLVAASTDAVDGYLARFSGTQSTLGRLLDPIADKILLLGTFGALWVWGMPSVSISPWFFNILLVREICIVIGSMVLIIRKKSYQVRPHMLGKITTCVQIMFVMWLFVRQFFMFEQTGLDNFLPCVVACVSLVSLVDYVVSYMRASFD